ncbi:MAG: hypothetical protein HC799_19605 [Limnothrix sp. RL_2_0]|nr:hypothetical protein [Limnothrix sp. RL_2_0]
MDNSAANLFGFGAGDNAKKKSTKKSNIFLVWMNSAANVFGFEAGDGSVKGATTESTNMENSSAFLVGFGSEKEGTVEQKGEGPWGGTGGGAEGPQGKKEAKKTDHPQGQGSLSNFLNGSGSGWPKNESNAIKEGDDESSSSSEDKNKKNKPAISSYEPRSFATTAAVVTPQVRVETKKKLFPNDSDSDDSDINDDAVSKEKSSVAKDVAATKTTDDGDANQSARVAKATSVGPPHRKKSFLDDSDSEDDSSSDESTPRRPPTKGRLYAPNKTESTIPLMAGKTKDAENSTKDSDGDSSSDEESPRRSPTKGKLYAPNKTDSTIPLMAGKTSNKDVEDSDSSSDDSSPATQKETKTKDNDKFQPVELNAFPDDGAVKIDSVAEAKVAEKSEAPKPCEPTAFLNEVPDGFVSSATAKGKEPSELKDTVEEKSGSYMITSDSASNTTDIPSYSTKPIQPAERSDPEDIDDLPEDATFQKDIPPDVPEIDPEPALAAVEVPEDKLEEDEWQAALMGLAEEKQKNEEEEWQSALLKIQSELEEERKLASSPKAQVKPKNKAKPVKKKRRTKQIHRSRKT